MSVAIPAPTPLTADERAVIARVVDQAPPLTESTRSRLSALLRQPDGFAEAARAAFRGER
ncbi:hypothetical protein GCM10027515_31930 [Schumannella luteola]|uniref:Uncharacterized protein n=1 Tax=Schumannella luteola TaxID=472059 RepID=A0A852Y7T0_9MICO|nr:hypothetical protein [Schumannella luteola]NYG99006.1 hypothetical protein [Schumannella luteola]